MMFRFPTASRLVTIALSDKPDEDCHDCWSRREVCSEIVLSYNGNETVVEAVLLTLRASDGLFPLFIWRGHDF